MTRMTLLSVLLALLVISAALPAMAADPNANAMATATVSGPLSGGPDTYTWTLTVNPSSVWAANPNWQLVAIGFQPDGTGPAISLPTGQPTGWGDAYVPGDGLIFWLADGVTVNQSGTAFTVAASTFGPTGGGLTASTVAGEQWTVTATTTGNINAMNYWLVYADPTQSTGGSSHPDYKTIRSSLEYVPEPGTMAASLALLSPGGISLALWRLRRRRSPQ